MSFLSALGHVGHVLAAGNAGAVKVTDAIQPFAPLISQIPAVGGPFAIVFNAIVQVEHLVGDVSGKGADKKAAVQKLVALAYPGIDQAALSSAIDGIVKILNDLSKLAPAKV